MLVEGSDDRQFFEKFIDLVTCEIIVAQSKDKVVSIIQELDSRGFSGTLGVIDADFDQIENKQWGSRNLIILETHDLETLLIRSAALDEVLLGFGSKNKIKKFGCNIRNTLVAAAISIGCLRLHSLRTKLDLRFQGLKYVNFIDKNTLAINHTSLVRQVLNRSRRQNHPIDDLEAAIRTIELSAPDPWQICTGDDLVSILGLALRKALGTNNSKDVSCEVLCRSLRLAYSDNDFASSQLIVDIRDWENRNPKFQVLR